ncbi:hypothetical protein CTI14_67880, partial [Methylobacterium radiotolerans]
SVDAREFDVPASRPAWTLTKRSPPPAKNFHVGKKDIRIGYARNNPVTNSVDAREFDVPASRPAWTLTKRSPPPAKNFHVG